MIDKLLFSSQKPRTILWVIFLMIFLFRLPALFNDYYDVDELYYAIYANEILEGGTPYVDYLALKPPLIHYFFALVFLVFGEGNLYAVHFVTVIIIAFSSLFLYKTVFLLVKDYSAAYFTALVYGVFITAFDESFMASSTEVLFNLPVSIACYAFVKYYFEGVKKYYLVVLSGFLITVAFLIKPQGVVLLGAILAYLIIFLPIKKGFFLSFHIGLWSFLSLCFALLLMYLGGFLKEAVEWTWLFNFTYMKFSQAPIIKILLEFFKRQSQLWVSQLLLWLFLLGFLWNLITLKKENIVQERGKAFFLFLFFIFSYLSIFLGGIRLYFHYFIQYLPSLSLIAGFQFFKWKEVLQKKRNLVMLNGLILLPVLFFTLWHYHDLYKKYFVENPLTPRNFNYLVERSEFKKVTQWIRENSSKQDKIFVWGECPQIYYFTRLRAGTRFITSRFITLNNSPPGKRFDSLELHRISHPPEKLSELLHILINDLKREKPRYVIDTSPSDFYGYKHYPIKSYPLLDHFLQEHYRKKISLSQMDIWEIID